MGATDSPLPQISPPLISESVGSGLGALMRHKIWPRPFRNKILAPPGLALPTMRKVLNSNVIIERFLLYRLHRQLVFMPRHSADTRRQLRSDGFRN